MRGAGACVLRGQSRVLSHIWSNTHDPPRSVFGTYTDVKFNALGRIMTVHLVPPMGEDKSAWSDRLLDSHFSMSLPVFIVERAFSGLPIVRSRTEPWANRFTWKFALPRECFTPQTCGPTSLRSLIIPLRMRAFTVPSGSFSLSAISFWVSPWKYAISITWR